MEIQPSVTVQSCEGSESAHGTYTAAEFARFVDRVIKGMPSPAYNMRKCKAVLRFEGGRIDLDLEICEGMTLRGHLIRSLRFWESSDALVYGGGACVTDEIERYSAAIGAVERPPPPGKVDIMPPTDTTVRISVHNVSVSSCHLCPFGNETDDSCDHYHSPIDPSIGLHIDNETQPKWCPLGLHPVTITKANP